MVQEIVSSITLTPTFPKSCHQDFLKNCQGGFLLQHTLQHSWTASRSLRHCSDTKKSSIRETDQNNSIHPLCKNINIVPCPRVTFYYVILEKRGYTREDTRLHTLISYVLLLLYISIHPLLSWSFTVSYLLVLQALARNSASVVTVAGVTRNAARTVQYCSNDLLQTTCMCSCSQSYAQLLMSEILLFC